jgi:hypothetical protein
MKPFWLGFVNVVTGEVGQPVKDFGGSYFRNIFRFN